MAISQPTASDPLNSPDHSLMHRQIATDPSTPVQSLTIDSTGALAGGTPLFQNVNPTNLLINGDFELWTAGTSVAPDGWVYSGASGSVAREASIIKLGTYSAKLTRVTNDCRIIYDFDDIKGITYWKGRKVTFGCWVYATVAARARIYMFDGVGYSNVPVHTGGSTWEWLTATITVNASATTLYVELEVIDGNTSAYFDGAICVEGSSAFAFAPKPVNADASWLPTVDKAIALGGASNQFSKVYTPAIAFPATQVADAGANILDDYEEGTWDATVTCGTSGTITLLAVQNQGRYTKIGRTVTISGAFVVTSVSSPVGYLQVNGLPFTSAAGGELDSYTGIAIHTHNLNVTGTTTMLAFIPSSSAIFYIEHFTAGLAADAAADFKATSQFIINATYTV
jgi:hypothetical protein